MYEEEMRGGVYRRGGDAFKFVRRDAMYMQLSCVFKHMGGEMKKGREGKGGRVSLG